MAIRRNFRVLVGGFPKRPTLSLQSPSLFYPVLPWHH